jgi:hypothetical protein
MKSAATGGDVMRFRSCVLFLSGLAIVTGCQTEAIDDQALALVTTVHVDDGAPPGGDGTPGNPFNNLPDAVEHAGGLSGAITILLAPGQYPLSNTLAIDFPVEVRGSNQLVFDGSGWPTGAVAPGTSTQIVGTAALGTDTLVKVGSETGPVISGGVTFRDLSFVCTSPNAHALHIVKTQGFTVTNNTFSGGNISVFPVASSGLIDGNSMRGVGVGVSVNAGTPGSPADVTVTGNRSSRNRFGGVLLNGSGFDLPETNAHSLEVTVSNNDLSFNAFIPEFSFGIRVFVIRRDNERPGDGQNVGALFAHIEQNLIEGNEIGLTLDAGFPFRNYTTGSGQHACDDRVYEGSVDLELLANTLIDSELAPALLSFTRNSASFDPGELQAWQFLHFATYNISDPHFSLNGFLVDHPATDPFVGGLCPGDVTHEALDNHLVYNQATIPNQQTVP